MLHVSPEPFFRDFFSKKFGRYETADFRMKNVDPHVDPQDRPFADQSYDFVSASHVLEYVPYDDKAISERGKTCANRSRMLCLKRILISRALSVREGAVKVFYFNSELTGLCGIRENNL